MVVNLIYSMDELKVTTDVWSLLCQLIILKVNEARVSSRSLVWLAAATWQFQNRSPQTTADENLDAWVLLRQVPKTSAAEQSSFLLIKTKWNVIVMKYLQVKKDV